jgi:UPF0755 protein
VRRFVTIPEGMPSMLVWERLMAEPLLTGDDPGANRRLDPARYLRLSNAAKARAGWCEQMQAAMDKALAEEWAKRKPRIAVDTMREALILAAIVEKETGKPEERRMVAGLYSNRVRTGMKLQADPTIIYPITKGKPLGRRIRQSEISCGQRLQYLYPHVGLPRRPRSPIRVANRIAGGDGSGKNGRAVTWWLTAPGHAFGRTLQEHNANVEKWYTIRKERGDF